MYIQLFDSRWASPEMSIFWFLKKGCVCAHKAVLSTRTIFFLRLTPCWDVPPVVQSSSTNQRQPHTKKPAWSVEINGQNYSFWQSSSHITLRPHSYHYWRFHLREKQTCFCCTVGQKAEKLLQIWGNGMDNLKIFSALCQRMKSWI